jgi:hypothetical protein
MPPPAISEWEWLNWKFPRPIHAGDTIYAHWMLTQKRPPGSGAAASIAVWRVDVHTIDGALCAEGEVGAKVARGQVLKRAPEQPAPAAQPAAAVAARRRRRRPRSNGAGLLPEPPPVAAPPAPVAKPERASGPSRRRRRRRPSGSPAREEEHEPRAAHAPETAAPELPAVPVAPASPSTPPADRKGIGGVLRRLRGS